MKIIVIGATGAVGKTAVQALSGRHDIITAGRSSGDITVDLEDYSSIQAMYKAVDKVDAVICAIGHGHFGPIAEMTPQQCRIGINAKAMAQINLVLAGVANVSDGGSFTLTSGVLNRDPIRGGAAAAAANGAIDGFVAGAAVDMPRGLRINAVSPEVLEASRTKYDGFFRGHNHVSDHAVGKAFSKSVEGCLTGQILIVE